MRQIYNNKEHTNTEHENNIQVIVHVTYNPPIIDNGDDPPFLLTINRWSPVSPNHRRCPHCKRDYARQFEVYQTKLYRLTADEVVRWQNLLYDRAAVQSRGKLRPMFGCVGWHYSYTRDTVVQEELDGTQ